MKKNPEIVNGGKSMKANARKFLHCMNAAVVATLLMLFPLLCAGQAQLPGQTPADVSLEGPQESAGVNYGGYKIQQSFELGYRYSAISGSPEVYDTFVNLHTGPRLLNQSLAMRSDNNSGLLFDTLFVSSFGWGGDPSNALRLDASKNRWYNLNFSFRRDQNFFDYNLLGNPLNPSTTAPGGLPVTFSPHQYQTRRRMYDFGFTLLPQSKLSFRFDFNRNRNEGPTFDTYHVGTEALLFQPLDFSANTYRAGVDYRILKRTTISFDFIYENATDTTDKSLAPFAIFPLANGSGVSLGVSAAPCTPQTTGGAVNPACNAFSGYTQTQDFQSSIPQEQITFQSRSIKNLDLVGRYSYSHAHADTPYNELFTGRESRTNLAQSSTSGEASTHWDTDTAEISATYRLSPRLRLMDEFRFYNFHIPGTFNQLQYSYFSSNLLSPIPTAAPFPHTTSSEPDIAPAQYLWFLGQDEKMNLAQVAYDFTKRMGITVGYRYRHRVESNAFANFAVAGPAGTGELFYPTNPLRGDCGGGVLNPDGTCNFIGQFDGEDDRFVMAQHSGLVAFWARPTDALHANADIEISSLGSSLTSASGGYTNAQSFLTRLTPTNQQKYRARVSYLPRPWLTMAANFNDLESRNSFADIGYRQHSRNVGFNVDAMPSGPIGFDVSYNYNDYMQNANICFAETATAVPVTTVPCSDGSGLLQANSYYQNYNHFGSFMLTLKPLKRVSANLGYSITSVSGNTLLLNPLQPLGPLSYNYHQPVGSFSVVLTKNVTWNAAYNYYEYDERDIPGPPGYRGFHSNLMTTSATISF